MLLPRLATVLPRSRRASTGLQYGVPPKAYVSKLTHMRFEPSGMTNDADRREHATTASWDLPSRRRFIEPV